jgi:hypothetical protein
MTMKIFAAALAAMTLVTAGAASAQDYRRGDRDWDWDRGDRRGRQEIVVRKDGRVMSFSRDDRMFYRLIDRPFNFRPGLTYAYTDRCNRQGCIAFVFDRRHRRPIDRIFAPHLRHALYNWRESRNFDRNYNRFGDYERDDRNWNNEDDRLFREGRNRGDWDHDLEGGRRPNR